MIFSFLFSTISIFSQTTFEKFYGNDSTDDFLTNIQSTNDGGYITVGESQRSAKSSEIHLVKFDANGVIEFSKKIGTPDIETANSVAVLENGYVIGGSTFVDGENKRNCYLVTVDLEGNLLEETTFGGQGDDIINAVASLENGDIAVAASYEDVTGTGANFHIRRYSLSLNLLAEIDYDNQLADSPRFIVEDKNSGNILVGGTSNARGFIMNCSPLLDMVLWTLVGSTTSYASFRTGLDFNDDFYAIGIKKYFGLESYIGLVNKTTGEYEELIPLPEPNVGGYTPLKIEKKNNHLYIFNGRSNTTPGRRLLKYNFVDDLFSEEYTLPSTSKDMTVHEDGKLAVVSEISSDIYKVDIVQAFNEDVIEDWSTEVGDFSNYSVQIGEQVIEAELGNIYLGGEIRRGSNSKTNIIINKINSSGTVIWESELNIGTEHKFAGITKAADNGCIVAVLYNTSGGQFNHLAFQKFNSDGTLDWFKEIDISDLLAIKSGTLVSNSNGAYYFSGDVSGPTSPGAVLFLKLDESFNVVEEKVISIPDGRFYSNKMIIDSNQDVLISGYDHTLSGRLPSVLKLSADGENIWKATTELDANQNGFDGITEGADGNFLLTYGGKFVSKISSDGVVLDTFFLAFNDLESELKDLCMAQDSSFYILDDFYKFPDYIGVISNPIGRDCIVVYHLDKDFTLLDSYVFGDGRGAKANRIFAHSEGGVIIYGEASKNNIKKGYLIGVNAEGVSSTIDIKPQGYMKLFPTVSSGNFTLSFSSPHVGKMALKIFDISGKIVYDGVDKKNGLEWEKELNITEMVSGLYFIHLSIGGYGWTKQLIKQ